MNRSHSEKLKDRTDGSRGRVVGCTNDEERDVSVTPSETELGH